MTQQQLSAMSPAQAAAAAGTSRWSIMRAINAGDLTASRDNRNVWRITPETLAAWLSRHSAHCAAAAAPVDPAAAPAALAHPDDTSRAEVEALRISLAVATTRAEAAEADRDAWRAHAERLASRAAEPVQTLQPAKRRRWLWSRA